MLAPFASHSSPDGQRHHLRLGDHRHAVEVERGQRLAGRQPGLGEMTLHPAPTSIDHLVLGQCGQEAGRRPALLVGLLGELGPHQLDAGQAQLVQQQLDAGGVDCGCCCVMPPPPGRRSGSTA